MFKLIKWIIVLFLVLLVLIIGNAAVAIVTINPNDFKPQITEQVKKSTGRDLTLAGDISWSFYPWLGLNLGKTSLANAAGFGLQPFAEIEEVDIKVKLLPLLKKSLQARQILIRGASLNLQKNSQGVDNWSDLAKSEEQSTSSPEESSSVPSDLKIHINGVKVVNAKLRFRDALSASDIEINSLNLTTGPIKIGQPIKLNSDFIFIQKGLNVTADLSASITANLDTGNYKVEDLNLTQTIRGEGFPEAGITTTQNLSLNANTNTQKLTINPISIEASGLILNGQINIDQFIDNPNYTGHFNTNTFNPKELLSTLEITLPETSNKNAFSNASLEFDLQGTKNSISLRSLQANLDESKLSGEFSLKDFTTQAMRFNFLLDKLIVDDYLSTSSASSPSTTTPASASDSDSDKIKLPLKLIRNLDLDGTAKIENLQVKKLQFTDSTVSLKANNGEIRISPLSAKAYNGSAIIDASLNAQTDTPAYRLKVDLSDVRSEEILETLLGERYLSGTAGFKANISTSANSITGLQKNLNGNFSAEFLDGTIKGSKLSNKINEARNFWRKLSGKPTLTEDITKDTKFSSLKASGNINNGIVTNQDLKILAPVFQAKGEGKVDLPSKSLNYTLSLADDGTRGAQRTFIPLQIIGPFDDLSFRLRGDRVLKDRAKLELDAKKAQLKAKLNAEKTKLESELQEKAAAKQAELEAKAAEKRAELEEKAQKKKADIKEKVDEKKQELEKKLKEELKNKLKGIF